MAFVTLGEALDRVLSRLAEQRMEKEAGGVETARQLAAAEGEDYRLRRDHHGSLVSAKPRKAAMGMKGVARRR
jgi:hypothetical protein